jgi:phenylalanyl-tRNA synthetase beta chain
MNISYEWLRSLVPVTLSATELRDLITAHTAPVDEVIPLRADLAGVVIGLVVEAKRHPDSDHLWVTRVDAGGPELLDVVCGAQNVTAGKLYPFAPAGTTLPGGLKLEKRKIRGAISNGMLCSSRELGLGDDHQGILELNVDAAPGTPFLKAVPVGDSRIVVDTPPNRPDLVSHRGIAREIAAVTRTPLRADGPAATAADSPRRADLEGITGGVRVRLDHPEGAPRYMGAVIRGVTVGGSPDWLVRRLEAVGSRSINNIVDATNYLMFELGQPMHAFDVARLAGPAVVIRRAMRGERLKTLDGNERDLRPEMTVIADSSRPHAVAGVMGGAESEVRAETKDIFLEVALFDPRRTRATRMALGLPTDASYRFERGVDPELQPEALARAVALIIDLAGGSLADAPIDLRPHAESRRPIVLRAARVSHLLGVPIARDESRRLLEAVGFTVEPRGSAELLVTVPSWRRDVEREVDLIEEVARLRGYDSFPSDVRPYRPGTTADAPLVGITTRIRDEMVAAGLYEARPMPFVRGAPKGYVRVSNPLAEDEAYLRRTLLESLAKRAEHNLARMVGDVRLFEVGSVFEPGSAGGGLPSEFIHAALLVMGARRPRHFTEPKPPAYDEWDARGLAERLAAAAFEGKGVELVPATEEGGVLWDIVRGGERVGSVRRVVLDAPVWASPAFGVELRLGGAPFDPAISVEAVGASHVGPPPFQPIPVTPAVEVDLALLVPAGVTAAEVERVVHGSGGDLLERVELFDEFTGAGVPEGYRSVGWRLTFRHPERTLRDKEVEGRRDKLLRTLENELRVRARTV